MDSTAGWLMGAESSCGLSQQRSSAAKTFRRRRRHVICGSVLRAGAFPNLMPLAKLRAEFLEQFDLRAATTRAG